MAVCTSIKLVETLGDTDMVLVTIDDEINAYMVFNYAESLKFVGNRVIVDYRKDFYNGRIETFINTLTIPRQVSVLDREENIKLYTNMTDNNSNVCFRDLLSGQHMVNAIVYCVSSSYEVSDRAVWMELKVRDKEGRIAKLRLFDPERNDIRYDGMYIKANIKSNQFGLNTSEVTPMDLAFPPNPEIQIAKAYIENYFVDDTEMCALLNKTRLLETMKDYVELELGYALVRAAIQLDILASLKNSLCEIDFRAIAWAIMLQYGYITKQNLDQYSMPLRSIAFALQQSIPVDIGDKIMRILDVGEPKPLGERLIYKKVIDMANEVIRVKKVV